MDPRRPASDTSSYYSGSTGSGSVWSTSDSVSFVYTDDPDWAWSGFEGVRGAVTRRDDRRDDARVRVAAHFLRGPFAAHKPKKHSSHHRSHRGDSDTQSNYSYSSRSSSSSWRQGQPFRGPSPMPPQFGYPGSPHPQYQHPQHFDGMPHGQPGMEANMGANFAGANMGNGMGPPPPHPMAGQPPQPGFEAGFIQLNGGGGVPQQHPDPVWGYDTPYDGEPEIWD
ncbi:hypothetical protein F4861DRAFT_402505 [Xylaria intraflava]|nr:hypothetical protein F4861DRAFT_402505 [Xylaria intraflava]